MTVGPREPERYPKPDQSPGKSPPPGGNPPPLLTLTARAAVILALSATAGAVTGALYLGPARIATAIAAAVVVFFAAVRRLNRVIR